MEKDITNYTEKIVMKKIKINLNIKEAVLLALNKLKKVKKYEEITEMDAQNEIQYANEHEEAICNVLKGMHLIGDYSFIVSNSNVEKDLSIHKKDDGTFTMKIDTIEIFKKTTFIGILSIFISLHIILESIEMPKPLKMTYQFLSCGIGITAKVAFFKRQKYNSRIIGAWVDIYGKKVMYKVMQQTLLI
uniref:MICOS complex subunit n=1 Tax=Parastrongyloides trichosuri TaxID=131310 RepID=A0A0N4Z5H3_PARTI